MRTNIFLIIVLIAFTRFTFLAQDNAVEDVKLVVNQSLKIISVEKGESPNWDAFRSLYLPEAQFFYVFKKDGQSQTVQWTLEDFIKKIGPNYEKSGFLEEPIAFRAHIFNGQATVHQGYRWVSGGQTQFGVNSYYLLLKEGEWKIASTGWSDAKTEKEVKDFFEKD